LLHNPNQEEKITRSIYALSTHYQGNYVAIGNDIIHSAKYPQTLFDIEQVLEGLKTYPELVVDIETFDLRLKNAGLASIGFAYDNTTEQRSYAITDQFQRTLVSMEHVETTSRT